MKIIKKFFLILLLALSIGCNSSTKCTIMQDIVGYTFPIIAASGIALSISNLTNDTNTYSSHAILCGYILVATIYLRPWFIRRWEQREEEEFGLIAVIPQ